MPCAIAATRRALLRCRGRGFANPPRTTASYRWKQKSISLKAFVVEADRRALPMGIF